MSGAAQTARMVMRAPVARAPRPIRVPAPGTARRPAATAVSQPHEPTEREAARVARRVLTMPAPGAAPGPSGSRSAAAGAMPRVAAASASPPASLGVASSAGQPLPERVRQDMEPRLQADFSAVRVHTGDSAARASRRLNAAAFTLGHQVFFGRDRFQPESNAGRELIAHELTHTIQQGAAPQRAAQAPPLAVPRPQRSLQPGALPQITAAPVGPLPPVQRSVADPAAEVRVHQRSEPRVARLGIQDALDYFADKAAWIPGFTMFTFLLGFNPISLRAVSRTAANLLRALIQLLPGGPLITQALDNHGLIDRVAAWAEGQLSALGDIGASVRQSVDDFLDDLSWTDIFDLGGLWDRAKRIVSTPIDRIISFGTSLISGIIEFVKDAILRPIGALAQGTRAWPLLCAVLGYDPVTGDPSPRTPAALLGGFMTLIGQEEVWQNIQRGNAIGQAWAWFQGAMGDLMGFVTALPGTFIAAFRSLELVDIILVPRAFAKIVAVFASFAGRFLSWALGTVIKLLEIIFSVVAPGAMGYLRRAGGALQSIFRNPIGFIGNLVRAAKAGFQKFAGKFLDHLKAGVLIWLTGSLPGIYIPTALSLTEILKFVLSVLGLSWANLRAKLVTAVGEPAVRAMEIGFDLVRTLVTQGPAAAWEQLKESLANLKQMAIDALIDMVVNLVVTRAVPRLVAMFIPGAGFIGAIMAIWGTIQTFMAQLSRIMQVVTGFLNSIAAIASGNIAAAATRVDGILVNLLSLAISFLAGFAGLGRVADRVREVLARIRAPIDQALDRLVAWIVRVGQRFVSAVRAGARRLLQWWRKRRAVGRGEDRHTLQFDGEARAARLMVHSTPVTPVVFAAQFSTVKGTEAQRAEVTRAQNEIDRLKGELATAQTANADEATMTRLDGLLTVEFNKLGAALDAILAAGDGEGSEADPLPIDYPKRRAGAYPDILVGPTTPNPLPQSLLRTLPRNDGRATLAAARPAIANEPGFKAWDGRVRAFRATGGAGQALPNGKAVGLDAQFAAIAPGVRLSYEEKGSTGGGGKINRLFEPFGFRATADGMDGDHVMERQIGGPDAIGNLWPLPRGENRSSGATVKSIDVRFRRKADNVHVARTKRGKTLYLLIRSVRG